MSHTLRSRVEQVIASDLYRRIRVLLLGGPGLEIRIDPKAAPLLYECQQFLQQLESALLSAPDPPLSSPGEEIRQRAEQLVKLASEVYAVKGEDVRSVVRDLLALLAERTRERDALRDYIREIAHAIELPPESVDIASCRAVAHQAAYVHRALIAAQDELSRLRTERREIAEEMRGLPRYVESDVVRRSSMAEYVSAEDVEALLDRLDPPSPTSGGLAK